MLFFKLELMDKSKDGMMSKTAFMALIKTSLNTKAKALSAKGGDHRGADERTPEIAFCRRLNGWLKR